MYDFAPGLYSITSSWKLQAIAERKVPRDGAT